MSNYIAMMIKDYCANYPNDAGCMPLEFKGTASEVVAVEGYRHTFVDPNTVVFVPFPSTDDVTTRELLTRLWPSIDQEKLYA